MFLNKIRNIFCVPDTKFVSATNVALAGKPGNICVGNNVSSFARALIKNNDIYNTRIVKSNSKAIYKKYALGQLLSSLVKERINMHPLYT